MDRRLHYTHAQEEQRHGKAPRDVTIPSWGLAVGRPQNMLPWRPDRLRIWLKLEAARLAGATDILRAAAAAAIWISSCKAGGTTQHVSTSGATCTHKSLPAVRSVNKTLLELCVIAENSSSSRHFALSQKDKKIPQHEGDEQGQIKIESRTSHCHYSRVHHE